MNQYLARSVMDWLWYFQSAKAEMGISSSWEPLVAIAKAGGPAAHQNYHRSEERRLAASRRHARIEKALIGMPGQALSLVRMTCETPLASLRIPFGQLGNVAHLTEAARNAHRASQTKREVTPWLDRLAIKAARSRATVHGVAAIAEIRRGCEVLMEKPRDEYVRALGRVP